MASAHKFLPDPKTVAIVGCPFSGGQPKPGVDQGPIHLIQAGLVQQLESLGYNVQFDGHHQFENVKADLVAKKLSAKTNGDVDVDVGYDSAHVDPPIGILKNPRLVSGVCKELRDVVKSHCEKGQLVLTIGGDHSLAMGTISGSFSKYPDACVIWVDAHADLNTIESTPSGNIHGMPLSFLMGLNKTYIPEFEWIEPSPSASSSLSSSTSSTQTQTKPPPILPPSRIAYIGLRDVDPGEKSLLKQHGIKAFSMHEVDKYGIGRVVEMALDCVNPGRERAVHLSFDVDALDPSVAPSTGTPVRGGLTFREGHYICEAIHETGLLVAMDIMEVNPSLADQDSVAQTVAVGCSLVRSALGETLL